jgi:hypothetical protein
MSWHFACVEWHLELIKRGITVMDLEFHGLGLDIWNGNSDVDFITIRARQHGLAKVPVPHFVFTKLANFAELILGST